MEPLRVARPKKTLNAGARLFMLVANAKGIASLIRAK